jgi:hypothetical protein
MWSEGAPLAGERANGKGGVNTHCPHSGRSILLHGPMPGTPELIRGRAAPARPIRHPLDKAQFIEHIMNMEPNGAEMR